jgi:hypothetical protein
MGGYFCAGKRNEARRCGGLSSVVIVVSLLWSSLTAWSSESSRISVEVDGVSLAIPREFVRTREDPGVKSPRHSVTLSMAYPDMRAASALERTTGHIPNSSHIIVGVSESLRIDFAEYMASELERLKSPSAQMQQLARSDDLEDLPSFEVYRHVRGQKGSVVYVKHIAGEQVLARCSETAPNPGCVVSFRWQKNILVRYFFRRHWLSDLDRMHTALRHRLQSFVVVDNSRLQK